MDGSENNTIWNESVISVGIVPVITATLCEPYLRPECVAPFFLGSSQSIYVNNAIRDVLSHCELGFEVLWVDSKYKELKKQKTWI